MSFRLFGVEVTIRGWFWIGTGLLGLASVHASAVPLALAIPIWVLVVLVSILVHEFGHAFAVMRHGIRPAIVLHAMGGTTSHSAGRLSRWDDAVISLAGPAAGLVLGTIVYAGASVAAPLPALGAHVVRQLLWVNIAWSVVNLVPVLPFDGGHVLEAALGPRRERTTATVSLVCAAVVAALFMWFGEPWGAVLFLMSAIQSYQRLTLPPGAVLVDPMAAPARGGRGGGPSPLRRWWLQWKLKRLQAQAEELKTKKRASGPALRVIKGGADEPPKDKRYLN